MKAIMMFAAILVLLASAYADLNIIKNGAPIALPPAVLEEAKYKEFYAMTSEQIADNFDKIDDLTKIAATKEEAFAKAKEAIKKEYGVEIITLGEGANIKNNVLSATYGKKGHLGLTNDYYEKGRVSVNAFGEVVFLPDANTIVIPPKTDKVRILPSAKKGLSIEFPNKKSIFVGDGINLFFDKGQPNIVSGTVDGVYFFSENSDPIPIFFESKIPAGVGDFIMLDTENKRLLVNAQKDLTSIDINFIEGNPFFEGIDAPSFVNVNAMDLLIENRAKEQKIPFVRASLKEGYDKLNRFMLEDGNFYIIVDPAGYALDKVSRDLTSSPLSFVLEDNKGKNLIMPSKKLGTIVIDENSFRVLSADSKELMQAEQSVAFKYLEFMKQFKKDFPSLELEDNTEGLSRNKIENLAAILKNLPPQLLDSIKLLRIHDANNPASPWPSICDVGWAAACVEHNSGLINVQLPYNEDEYVIYHEAAHTLTNKLEDYDIAKITELRRITRNIEQKIYRLQQEGKNLKGESQDIALLQKQALTASRLNNYYGNLFKALESRKQLTDIKPIDPGFKERWHLLNPNYKLVNKIEIKNPQNTAITSVEFRWKQQDSSGSYDGPRYGFVGTYGGQNFYEDVATFAEKVHTDPSFFKSVIKQDSPTENVYLRKIGLLYEYGFINSADYWKVLSQLRQEKK